MSRPEFPTGVVLPVEFIWSINERQVSYDADPAGYERREREREEQRQWEAAAEQEAQRLVWEDAQREAWETQHPED